jgi:hypothetical protein
MRKLSNRLPLVVVLVLLARLPASSQNSLPALDGIVHAHHAGPIAPASVEMTGNVERGGKTVPFRIIGTRDEALRIEYGGQGKDTLVMSQKQNFHDDGEKVTYPKVPSGFAELDITGLFFVQQLRNRAVRVETSEEGIPIGGVPTTRIRVQSDRNQKHKGTIRVDDRVDIYVTKTGLLAGIVRSFYEGRPDRYTQAFSFSDFRETAGVLLPYRIDVHLKGKRIQTFSIENYRFDVPADREMFVSRRAR